MASSICFSLISSGYIKSFRVILDQKESSWLIAGLFTANDYGQWCYQKLIELIWQFQCLFQWATWQICEIWIWILKICLTFWRINTVDTDIKEGLLSYDQVKVVKWGMKVHFHLFISSPTSLPDITMTNINQIWLRSGEIERGVQMYPLRGDWAPKKSDKK